MKKLAAVLCAVLAAQGSALACSAFLLKGDNYQVVGLLGAVGAANKTAGDPARTA